jgi:hypothetical protein
MIEISQNPQLCRRIVNYDDESVEEQDVAVHGGGANQSRKPNNDEYHRR